MRTVKAIFRGAAAALLLLPAVAAADALPKADKVLVLKSQRQLQLLRDGTPFRTYRVALGLKPVGHKERQGDHRTPEGTYVIKARKPDSRFYRALEISYPDAQDLEAARQAGVSPGGNIMIHGLPPEREAFGEIHTLWDWTNGCIAVTNREMDEIWAAVEVGTPIEIRP